MRDGAPRQNRNAYLVRTFRDLGHLGPREVPTGKKYTIDFFNVLPGITSISGHENNQFTGFLGTRNLGNFYSFLNSTTATVRARHDFDQAYPDNRAL